MVIGKRILSSALLILAVLSCNKELTGPAIAFWPYDEQETKALLSNEGLKTENNRIRILDVVTGFSGSASWMGESPYYIDDNLLYTGNPVWEFESGRFYPWTTDGSHHFFGWLGYDASLDITAEAFFGTSNLYDAANQVLSIPTLEMGADTPIFDFLYTGLPPVDASTRSSGTPVDLPLEHLFSAIGLTINNTSGNRVLLKSVVLKGMKNRRSARIDFTGSTPYVTTADISSTDVILYASSNPLGDSYDNRDYVLPLSEEKPFLLMWPQTFVDLEGAQLLVEYNIQDALGVISDDLSATLDLSSQPVFRTSSTGMDAGTRYSFLLQFKKSTLDLYTRALPWEYEEYDWDYSEHSISARGGMFKDGVLAFYRGSGNDLSEPTSEEWAAKSMRFTTRNEVMTGRFYIEAPTSGVWQITTYPLSAAQYFIVSPTSGEIDANTDNGKAEFTVRANPEMAPIATQTLYFNVSLFFNGEWHDANSEFNRKNIKLVLDAN